MSFHYRVTDPQHVYEPVDVIWPTQAEPDEYPLLKAVAMAIP